MLFLCVSDFFSSIISVTKTLFVLCRFPEEKLGEVDRESSRNFYRDDVSPSADSDGKQDTIGLCSPMSQSYQSYGCTDFFCSSPS